MSEKRTPLFLLILILALTGCLTSRGDLFEKVTAPAPEEVESGKGKESRQEYDETVDETDDYTPGIEITTYPSGGDIWFARAYMGRSSVFVENPSTGTYFIRITKPGYYPVEEWVHFQEDTYLLIDYYLEEIQGYLEVSVLPAGAEVRVDGKRVSDFPAALQIGQKTLEISLFGYKTRLETVEILENRTTRLDILLEDAPFALSDASVSRRIFNPDNPDPFGTVTVRFTADNRGSADILVTDHKGTVVRTMQTGPFTERNQAVQWDGLNGSGLAVTGGTYRIRIVGLGKDGTVSETSTPVTVDRTLIVRQRNITTGYSGMLYCPTPDILASGGFQAGVSALGAFIGGTALVPVQTGVRFALPGDMEAAFQGNILAVSDEDDGYSAGFSLKLPLAGDDRGIFSHALGVKLTYQGVRYTDTLTNFTGLSVTYPLSLALGPLRFYCAPEGVLSFNRVDYDASTVQTPGFHAWAYGRLGLAVETPRCTAGISAAFRTTPFFTAPFIHWPMELGGEVNILLPGTQFFLSVYGTGEIDPYDGYYFLFGGGLHFLY